MTFYDEMRDIATELLTEFAQGEISLISITPGNGPAHNPGAPVETPKVLPGAVARGASFKYVTSGLAVASDLQVTISVETATPKMNDFIQIKKTNGTVTRLKIVQIIDKPDPDPVVRVCIIRKG